MYARAHVRKWTLQDSWTLRSCREAGLPLKSWNCIVKEYRVLTLDR